MNQTKISLFSSGLELANSIATTDVLNNSWDAISETRSSISQISPFCVTYKEIKHQSGTTILAFASADDFTVDHLLQEPGKDLVSSETLKNEFPHFEFIGTKVNGAFSIHRAAIDLYKSLHSQLSALEIDLSKQVVITGHSLGGSLASLFSLALQHTIDQEILENPKKIPKRPLCITFGSPLLGDDGFQKAISERSAWTACLLNVVSNHDPIPRSLATSSNARNSYMPFGTFFFCSESGSCATFEEPESILGMLAAMSVANVQTCNYGEVLDKIKKKAICRDISELGQGNLSTLCAGITLQLKAIGLLATDNNALIAKIEAKQAKILRSKKNVYEPTKKLNDMKISMTYMEWYKKSGTLQAGYYDSYKNPRNIREIESQQNIITHQRGLTQYWEEVVKEKDTMPQKEGAKLRSRWLYAGNNYRRMIEPLDIAEYYKDGKRDYINKGRSPHYVMLEKWMKEDQKESKPRDKASSLTDDSCFWAHVEDAIISCKVLKDSESSVAANSLLEFEKYLMNSIKSFSVSPEIFLDRSSFMQWWKDYETIKGDRYNSEFMNYMRTGDYQLYE